MTQLFDTTTYADEEADAAGRHLHSVPTGQLSNPEVNERTTQWRLDDSTIEIGRKGIQAARQALRDAAKRAA